MIKVALVGNPNSGKTTLFNALTGATAHVGNWPGVTVDKLEGLYKKCEDVIQITDLPGIYSLAPYTSEEIISRNFILNEKPDCIINIVDATNLERNLYLTTQLLEIDVPVVIALNMMDVVVKNGDTIDIKALEDKMGIPVVEISALKSDGIHKLMETAYNTSKTTRKARTVIKNSPLAHLIGDVKIALEAKGIDNPLFHSIKLVELDEIEMEEHKDTVKMIEDFKNTFEDETFKDDFYGIVANERYEFITKDFDKILKRKERTDDLTISDKADKVLTHKIWGIPIFLVILLLIFHVTFAEDLFYLSGVLPEGFLLLEGTPFEGVFGDGCIYSPGVILMNLVTVGLDALSSLIASWFVGAEAWVTGLVIDGIVSGLFAIIGFLPQILMLFLLFSILEDSGYMARVVFILDRIFRKFGLSGRAFIPMIMGFGCSVPAIINTRTLADEKEKTATIRVIPFFSCGAKLPILTAISGAVVQLLGFGNADIITYSIYLLGLITALVTVIIMRKTTMRGKVPPFIMELPSYHAPRFSNLMAHLWDKAKHFIEKAFTIILISTVAIWFLTNFSWDYQYLEGQVDQSILGSLGKLIQPLFTPLGFGSQLNSNGWVFAVAAIMGLIAKENVIAALGTLAACITVGFTGTEEGVHEVVTMAQATGITECGLIAFMAFNLLTIPCFAAVASAKAELPKAKFKSTIIFWLVTSYVVSSMVYLIGSFPWTIAIFVILIALGVLGIYLYNKNVDKKVGN